MKTEHFPSLDLCKKLTEIWFPETHYLYLADWTYVRDWFIWTTDEKNLWFNAVCPSVMEMLDEIPIEIKKDDIWYMLVVWGNWCVQYYPDNFNSFHIPLADFRWNIPNALAEMILWLHKNNYISFSN